MPWLILFFVMTNVNQGLRELAACCAYFTAHNNLPCVSKFLKNLSEAATCHLQSCTFVRWIRTYDWHNAITQRCPWILLWVRNTIEIDSPLFDVRACPRPRLKQAEKSFDNELNQSLCIFEY